MVFCARGLLHFSGKNARKVKKKKPKKKLLFSKQQILDTSKLKDFADNKLKFDENGRKFSKWVENSVGKG